MPISSFKLASGPKALARGNPGPRATVEATARPRATLHEGADKTDEGDSSTKVILSSLLIVGP
jgi:hypothetical protein